MDITSEPPRISTSSAPLSLPPSCSKHSASKMDYLYEITHLPETADLTKDSPIFMNPYHAFRKARSTSFTQSIKTLVSSKQQIIKEYVQSSSFSQHPLQSTTDDQYVTLEIPPEFFSTWSAQGYTHLHIGAVRLALTYHGRKGLPVFARVALLDSRYLEYQHAVIGTVQTSLIAGTVMFTFFPNFNMSFRDPHASTALKVQIQLSGAPQVFDSTPATLHHQMAYRVQNHAIDLALPVSDQALLILADTHSTPTSIHIPRQISRTDLLKLFPKSWITNYEKLHNSSQPVQSSDLCMSVTRMVL